MVTVAFTKLSQGVAEYRTPCRLQITSIFGRIFSKSVTVSYNGDTELCSFAGVYLEFGLPDLHEIFTRHSLPTITTKGLLKFRGWVWGWECHPKKNFPQNYYFSILRSKIRIFTRKIFSGCAPLPPGKMSLPDFFSLSESGESFVVITGLLNGVQKFSRGRGPTPEIFFQKFFQLFCVFYVRPK